MLRNIFLSWGYLGAINYYRCTSKSIGLLFLPTNNVTPQTHHQSKLKLMKETERLLAEPAPGISAQPHEDNLRYFDVVITGPETSPFEGAAILIKAGVLNWSCFFLTIIPWPRRKCAS